MKSRVTIGTAKYLPPTQIERTWDVFPNEKCTMSVFVLPIKQLSVVLRIPILYITMKKNVYPQFKWEKVWK